MHKTVYSFSPVNLNILQVILSLVSYRHWLSKFVSYKFIHKYIPNYSLSMYSNSVKKLIHMTIFTKNSNHRGHQIYSKITKRYQMTYSIFFRKFIIFHPNFYMIIRNIVIRIYDHRVVVQSTYLIAIKNKESFWWVMLYPV